MSEVRETGLLIGLGAQKAGTSWLFDYLNSHPDVHSRWIKEVSFFSLVDRDERRFRIALHKKNAEALREIAKCEPLRAKPALEAAAEYDEWVAQFSADKVDLSTYLAFMRRELHEPALLVDISPTYAAAPANLWRMLAERIENVRFLYLLRDPVDRLWSSIRMHIDLTEKRADGFDYKEPVRRGCRGLRRWSITP